MPRPQGPHAGTPLSSTPRNPARRPLTPPTSSHTPEGARPRTPRRAPTRPNSTSNSAPRGALDGDYEAAADSALRASFYPAPEEYEDIVVVPPLIPPHRASSSDASRWTDSASTSASALEPIPASRTSRSSVAPQAKPRREPRADSSSNVGSNSKPSTKARREPRGLWFEIGGVLAVALGAMLAWNALRAEPQGWLPWHVVGLLRTLLGIGAYVVPLMACALGVLLIVQRQRANLRAFWRGMAVSLLVLLSGVHLGVPMGMEFDAELMPARGGLLGASIAWALRRLLGEAGAAIALVALAVVALLLLTEVSLAEIAETTAGALGRSKDAWHDKAQSLQDSLRNRFSKAKSSASKSKPKHEDEDEEDEDPHLRPRRSSAQSRAQVLAASRQHDEPNAFDAHLRSPRQSPFFAPEEIGAAGPAPPEQEPDSGEPQVLADSAPDASQPEAPAHPADRLQSVRVEIDLAPPPTSVLDAANAPAESEPAPQVLAAASQAARDAGAVPINAPDDDLTPAEALEAQATASSREEAPAPVRRRPMGFRRTFGDGPPMPEYFDQAVRSLDPPIVPDLAGVEEDIRESITTVEDTLLSFKVDARVTDVKRGPVITRYEVQPASGVRVAAIANLDRDLARALSAHAVRIEAPVPGKNVVGIEIPNKKVHLVRLRDVLELPEFLSSPSKLSFVLGKDIAGQPKWGDLTKMPHMLVAGATNSGKSVCLNAIIASIIARASPDEVKFSLIDPKRVELTLYRDIPHLYHPVVVEPKDAVKVLRGMIVEMDRRYKKFAEAGVRNIVSYNQKLDPDDMPLPYIVIVIDELADLMMTAAAEFEKLICRLAQLARATGIHLIVATQRPSVNVITGVIKANIPARVAFAVASQVDSRTILDAVGAERLIGSGDMLFDANNGGKAVRIQGAYLSEDEVNRIVQVAKGAYRDEPREYGMDLNQFDETNDDADDKPVSTSRAMPDDRRDDMYDEVREFILRHQEVSASMIQRKYEIGFPRAARIVDQFERDGLLGPADGPKPRKVLSSGA